ncbi:MAG: polyhydroxyalkanoate synthesis repressor PhaR [Pseudomonadota bacterium]
MAKHSEDGAIVIKKYANRRLYNTAKSSYVTLDDLSHMVRAGEDFRVFDAKSGEDITRSVLTQIIFEQEAKGQNMLPTSFLRQLIRLYGDALQSVVPGYLDASMETFARNQERLRETFTQNPAMASFETLARSNMEWMERAMRMFGGLPTQGADGQTPPAAASPAKAAEGIGEDLDQLQKQLREMQSQLEKLSKDKTDES